MLGGGLAVGTVLLIEEDIYTGYYKSLLKYFLAEGLAVDHPICVATTETKPSKFLRKLPKNLTFEYQRQKQEEEAKKEVEGSNNNNNNNNNSNSSSSSTSTTEPQPNEGGPKMTIAWQYEKYLSSSNSSTSGQTVHRSGKLVYSILLYSITSIVIQ